MSLSARLILLLTITVGVIMSLGGYLILRQREDIHERALRSKLYAHAITLRLTLDDIYRAGRIGDAQRLIDHLSENPRIFSVTLFDEEGRVAMFSNPLQAEKIVESPEARQVISTGKGIEITQSRGGAWVPRGNGVSRSRLSKIKIPLSEGCMIREAAKADDIGRAVSRGCILMLGPDLLDLAEKLAAARNLAGTKSRSAGLRDGRNRIAAALDPPVLVDINYDLQVVEDRMLRLYPDVYDRGAFELDSLRAELQSAGVATSRLGDQSFRRGRLRRGRKLPLVDRTVEYEKEIALVRGGARK